MLSNLRVGWRQLVADPGYSAAILLGLSVAIACCCLVAQIVFNEVLPDPDVPDPVQVVRLEYRGNNPGAHEDWFDQAPFVFATTLRQAGAPVSAISRTVENDFDVRAGDRVANLGVVLADAQLVDVYGLRAVAGDLRDALRRPDTIALTVEAARKLFPAGDAVGKSVRVHGHTLTVDALLARRSGAAMDHADGLASFDSSLNTLPAEERTQWYSMSGAVVARVAGGHSADEVGKAAQALLDHGPAVHEAPPEWTANGRQAAFLRATPLTRQ
jgi:putative ABC transport system permease protein